MSKGKQWWTLQPTIDEQKHILIEFQQKLRDKQWLKKNEPSSLFYVYLLDGLSPTEPFESINTYFQISTYDSDSKNQGRVHLLRLLSLFLKIHILLKPTIPLIAPPSVFITPNLISRQFHYGLVGTIQATPTSKAMSFVVSEIELPFMSTHKIKSFLFPQTGDSYRWLTISHWFENKKWPSYGKWMYGSYAERKLWLDSILSPLSHSSYSSSSLDKILNEQGLFVWNIEQDSFFSSYLSSDYMKNTLLPLIKKMGGFFYFPLKIWIFPAFIEQESFTEFLETQKPKFLTQNYTSVKKGTLQHHEIQNETVHNESHLYESSESES